MNEKYEHKQTTRAYNTEKNSETSEKIQTMAMDDGTDMKSQR